VTDVTAWLINPNPSCSKNRKRKEKKSKIKMKRKNKIKSTINDLDNYVLVDSLLEKQNVMVTTSLRMTNKLLSKLKGKVSHGDY